MKRLKVAQVAMQSPRGNTIAKPISRPTRTAVIGPGPNVVRADTYTHVRM